MCSWCFYCSNPDVMARKIFIDSLNMFANFEESLFFSTHDRIPVSKLQVVVSGGSDYGNQGWSMLLFCRLMYHLTSLVSVSVCLLIEQIIIIMIMIMIIIVHVFNIYMVQH